MKKILFCLMLALCACREEEVAAGYPGYLEGDYRHLAAAVPGRLRTLAIAEGDTVHEGQALFTLEDDAQQAALAAARARHEALRAQGEDMTRGARAEEVARLEAQLAQAQTQAAHAQREAARLEKLAKAHAVSAHDAEAARAQRETSAAKVREMQAALAAAKLPARPAQRDQIAAQIRAAAADITAHEWQLAQTRIAAPADGRITQVYFREGEWVGAGQPVAALLPPNTLKALFYVPAETLPQLAIGTRVTLDCPGCTPFAATIRNIADRPEYTPPMLYDEAHRHELTYRIEAAVAGEAPLHPGQPVTVTLP